MTQPVRLQLSRRKSFNLQAVSNATNGLPAVNVARPSRWGNTWKVGTRDARTGGVLDAATAVERFTNALVSGSFRISEQVVAGALRGKNLACWCAPDAPCHADVLLEIANR
jgi:hypothetical protein